MFLSVALLAIYVVYYVISYVDLKFPLPCDDFNGEQGLRTLLAVISVITCH